MTARKGLQLRRCLNTSTKLFNQYNTFYWIIPLISVLQQQQEGFFVQIDKKKRRLSIGTMFAKC